MARSPSFNLFNTDDAHDSLGELAGVRDDVLLHLLDEAELALPDPGLILRRQQRAIHPLVLHRHVHHAGTLVGRHHLHLGHLRLELSGQFALNYHPDFTTRAAASRDRSRVLNTFASPTAATRNKRDSGEYWRHDAVRLVLGPLDTYQG